MKEKYTNFISSLGQCRCLKTTKLGPESASRFRCNLLLCKFLRTLKWFWPIRPWISLQPSLRYPMTAANCCCMSPFWFATSDVQTRMSSCVHSSRLQSSPSGPSTPSVLRLNVCNWHLTLFRDLDGALKCLLDLSDFNIRHTCWWRSAPFVLSLWQGIYVLLASSDEPLP